MSIREDFFTALNNGAKWDVGVSINRTNPLPLDANSVFGSLADAQLYAAGVLAYVGQPIAVVTETDTTLYILDQNKSLIEVGKSTLGDNKSIVLSEEGILSIKGLTEAETGAQLIKAADGSVSWQLPDTTTIEGISSQLTSLGTRVTDLETANTALETVVGNDASGLVKDVADLGTTVADHSSRISTAENNITTLQGQITGVFHFKGSATKNGANLFVGETQVINPAVGDVYTVGSAEWAWDGDEWIELGITADLSNFYDKSQVDAKIAGIPGALSFKGVAEADASGFPNIVNPQNGDVYIINDKEFAWDGSSWVELGFITDLSSYSTTDQVQAMIDGAIAGLYTFKGNATATSEGVPDIANPSVGDTYQVVVNNSTKQFAWDGNQWVELANTVDLSSYSTTAQVNAAISAAKTEVQNISASDATTKANLAKQEAIAHTDSLYGDATLTVGKIEDKTIALESALYGTNGTYESPAADSLLTQVSNLNAAIGEGGSVASQITSAIGNLDSTKTASAGKFISGITQTDGVITAIAETSLPDYTTNFNAKADKVSGAVDGHLASLDTNGNLVDAGVAVSDLATAAQGAKADTAVQSVVIEAGASNGEIKVTVDEVSSNVAVTGLKSAAFTESSDYATAGHNHDTAYAAKESTESHIGNSDIHVTAEQKTQWTTGAETASANASAITTLRGDSSVAGSIDSKISTAITNLDLANTYAAKVHGHVIGNIEGLQTALDAKATSANLTDHTGNNDIHVTAEQKTQWTTGAQKAASNETSISNLSTYVGTFTPVNAETTVVDYINAKIGAIPAQTDYTVTVSETSPVDYSKAYTFTQNGITLAAINIPKDMVVQSGTVETKAESGEWGEPGTYIHLILANATNDDIYINANNLIEYITSGSAVGDQIFLNINESHQITATLSNGSITLEQLNSDLQATLAKAHTHDNKSVLDGISQEDITSWDTAATKASSNESFINSITDKVATWDNVTGAATSVTTNDADLAITGNVLNIPLATATRAGIVKVDGTSIQVTDGVLSVKAVNVNTLFVAEGDELILNGGSAF